MQFNRRLINLLLGANQRDSQSPTKEPFESSAKYGIDSFLDVEGVVLGQAEVALGPRGVGVDAEDGLVSVLNFAGAHQKCTIST